MAHTRYRSEDGSSRLRDLPASALRASLRDGYGGAELRRDILAGLVVGIVALPLSMALGIGVGVAPQYGLYTAIIAGFLVAVLGGSRTQVTGPTAAFIVILAPIQQQFGSAGLLISGLLAGAMLIGMGLMRLGRLIHYIPHPVTTGFTAGIAIVIASLQIRDLLGLQLPHDPPHFLEKMGVMFGSLGTASWQEALVGFLTLAILVFFPRVTKRVPAPLVALPFAAVLAVLLGHLVNGFEVATIASRFHVTVGETTLHGIPQLPPMPVIPWNMEDQGGERLQFSFTAFRALLNGAFAIAMLGAIESLLSAVIADGMVRTKHDPDSELLALGVGNMVVPFFGGIAATGAIARTATNIRSGGRSPVASMVHALTILAAVLALAPLLGYLPMASLAALLLLVAWNMSEVRHFLHILRVAPKSDASVMLACCLLTVVFDMVVGVAVGMVLAAFLFMRRMAEVTQARLAGENDAVIPGAIPAGVAVYEISGPLFFGAAQKAMAALEIVSDSAKALIVILEDVNAMDATGLVALESALEPLARRRCLAILTGVREQPLGVLRKAGLDRRDGVVLCPTPAEALVVARAHVASLPSTRSGAQRAVRPDDGTPPSAR